MLQFNYNRCDRISLPISAIVLSTSYLQKLLLHSTRMHWVAAKHDIYIYARANTHACIESSIARSNNNNFAEQKGRVFERHWMQTS